MKILNLPITDTHFICLFNGGGDYSISNSGCVLYGKKYIETNQL